MSFVGEKRRELILDLLLHRITDADFYEGYGLQPGQGGAEGLAMLRRALQEQDPAAVEFGLYLGFYFGISPDYLPVLLHLAVVDWHESHEAVVDALDGLRAAESVDVLFKVATTVYPYRDYDDARSLAVKCTYALRKIQTPEAVARLGELLGSDDAIIRSSAAERLTEVVDEPRSEPVRRLAAGLLARSGFGTIS